MERWKNTVDASSSFIALPAYLLLLSLQKKNVLKIESKDCQRKQVLRIHEKQQVGWLTCSFASQIVLVCGWRQHIKSRLLSHR